MANDDIPMLGFGAGRYNDAHVTDRVPLVRGPIGAERCGWMYATDMSDMMRAGLAPMTVVPTFPEFEFSFNLAITIALIGGVIDRDISGISGLLLTDRLLELQPLADLPSTIGIAGQRITANGTLRVRFFTPIAIALSSTAINFRLTVKRG